MKGRKNADNLLNTIMNADNHKPKSSKKSIEFFLFHIFFFVFNELKKVKEENWLLEVQWKAAFNIDHMDHHQAVLVRL